MSIFPVSFRPALVLPTAHLPAPAGEGVTLSNPSLSAAPKFRTFPLFQNVREKWPHGFEVAEITATAFMTSGITACNSQFTETFSGALAVYLVFAITVWKLGNFIISPTISTDNLIRLITFLAPNLEMPHKKGDLRNEADFEMIRRTLHSPAFKKSLNKVLADSWESFLSPEEFQRFARIKAEALEGTKIAAAAILRNDLRMPLVEKLEELEWPLEALLLEAHRLASEISKKSPLKTSSRQTLLLESLTLGDLTDHLPTAWRKHPVVSFPLEVGEWQLLTGAIFHAARVEEIRSAFERDKPSLKQAEERFSALATAEYPEEKWELLLQVLLPLAGRDKGIAAAVRMLIGDPRQTVESLREFLAEGGAVSKTLRKLYHSLPPERWILKGRWRDGSEPLRNAPRLALKIREVWSSSIPKARKEAALLRMLQRFEKEAIKTALLPEFSEENEIMEVIRKAFAGMWVVSVRALERHLLIPLRRELEMESDKFEFQVTGRMILGVEPAKGLTDILYGDSTGVCTAEDVEAWKQPSFMLFRFTAYPEEKKNEKKIIGYAQIVLIESEAGQMLTIPGINPSHEFMKRVRDPELFFDKLVGAMAHLGRMAGFKTIGIPEKPSIHSNRPTFQRAVANRVKEGSYQVISIPEVTWNFGEDKFPFSSLAVPLFTKTEEV